LGRRIAFVVVAVLLLAVPASADAAKFGSRTLKMGSRGGDVKTLQRLLTKAGFEVSADGVFGSGTESVVEAWEDLNQRTVDGRVTRPDARALKADAAQGAADPVPDEIVSEDADEEGEDTGGGLGYVDVEPGEVNDDGTASPPDDAPREVAAIIAGGNEIFDKPYKYGGGHGKWKDSGYDCSGSVSYALHAAGLLKTSMDSTGFESYGDPGPGMWVSIYANAGHAYMVVAGLRFDTSGARERGGSRWTDEMRPPDGYVVRHPPGL
jgi:peptidoglycan hydrolase-like protein with peptidoglycan-binding domain